MLRLIGLVQNERATARIYRDAEWGEFRVVLEGRAEETTYYAEDLIDATGTARAMIAYVGNSEH